MSFSRKSSNLAWRGVAGRLVSLCAPLCASICAVALAVPPASAATPGWWPSEDAGVQAAWAAGVTGKGVRVAVIDTLPVSDVPAFKDADIAYHEAVTENAAGEPTPCSIDGWAMPTSVRSGDEVHYANGATYRIEATHGTSMLANIVGNGTWYDGQIGQRGVAPGASIDSYRVGVEGEGTLGETNPPTCGDKLFDTDDDASAVRLGKTIGAAADAGARIVSLSIAADMHDEDFGPVLDAMARGVILVAGRPNLAEEGVPAMVGLPGTIYGMPGVVGVSNVGSDGSLRPDVVDGNVSVLAPGDDVARPDESGSREASVGAGGTSTATSVLSGYLALAVQKWPDATGNQILQSLVRNTREGVAQGRQAGGVWLDPEHKRGFGQVDVQALLDTDPSQYPDINPILETQMTTAMADSTYKGWYMQDCAASDDMGLEWADPSGQTHGVPCSSGLFMKEYERQKAAWDKVRQCRADGGTDCMGHSATATAPRQATGGGRDTAGGKDGAQATGSPVPVWVWAVSGGFALLVVAGGVTLAVVLARRGNRNRHSSHGAHSGYGGHDNHAGPGTLPTDMASGRPPAGAGPVTGRPYPLQTSPYPPQAQPYSPQWQPGTPPPTGPYPHQAPYGSQGADNGPNQPHRPFQGQGRTTR